MIKKVRKGYQVIIRSGGTDFLIGPPVNNRLDAQRILKNALVAFSR